MATAASLPVFGVTETNRSLTVTALFSALIRAVTVRERFLPRNVAFMLEDQK